MTGSDTSGATWRDRRPQLGPARLMVLSFSVALLVVACTPAPAPVTTPTTTPSNVRGPISGCVASAASAVDATPGTDGAPVSSAEPATAIPAEAAGVAVVVALDPDERPHMAKVATDAAAATAAAVDADPQLRVVAVEAEVAVSATSSAPVGVPPQCIDPFRSQQWALDSLDIDSIHDQVLGDGVDIAVVDTGVDAAHPDLAGRVSGGASFVGSGGVPVAGGGAVDPHGHGTHVAGIAAAGAYDGVGVAGVAPHATIIPVRVLAENGSGVSSDVAAGITWAVDNGADVINLSLGGSYSAAVAAAVDYAESHGVVVVASAGNTGEHGGVAYPAALDDVIAVASHEPSGGLSSFSSRGAQVDVAAPGGNILSSYPGAQWRFMQGTSMAAPHVAGTVALMRSLHPEFSAQQVRDMVRSSADDSGDPGFDSGFGWGRLDARSSLGF